MPRAAARSHGRTKVSSCSAESWSACSPVETSRGRRRARQRRRAAGEGGRSGRSGPAHVRIGIRPRRGRRRARPQHRSRRAPIGRSAHLEVAHDLAPGQLRRDDAPQRRKLEPSTAQKRPAGLRRAGEHGSAAAVVAVRAEQPEPVQAGRQVGDRADRRRPVREPDRFLTLGVKRPAQNTDSSGWYLLHTSGDRGRPGCRGSRRRPWPAWAAWCWSPRANRAIARRARRRRARSRGVRAVTCRSCRLTGAGREDVTASANDPCVRGMRRVHGASGPQAAV